uniref:Glutathione peroxidase 3 n=1 Tax=Chrysemys picta bellii TaxID=8478 RepID=A0A8C3FSD0_CHRPI
MGQRERVSTSPCAGASSSRKRRRVSSSLLTHCGYFCPAPSHVLCLAVFQVDCYNSVEGTIYKYGAVTIDGQEYIPFGKYKGKMILFVNVATY